MRRRNIVGLVILGGGFFRGLLAERGRSGRGEPPPPPPPLFPSLPGAKARPTEREAIRGEAS